MNVGHGVDEQQLLERARSGDSYAEEQLICAYAGYVYECAKPYFLPGGEQEDLLQEGMIGLHEAIHSYEAERGVPFRAYAGTCVSRKLLSAVRAYSRRKHQLLNQSQSMSAPGEDGEELDLLGILPETADSGMEEVYLRRELWGVYHRLMETVLTPWEREVFARSLDGESYSAIAHNTGKTEKSVDSAMQRARKKLREAIAKLESS